LIARHDDARWQSYGSMATAMRRNPVPRPDLGNLQRRNVGGSNRQARVASRGRKSDVVSPIRASKPIGLTILDDLPQPIPVSQRELDVIETYLGDLLDEALGRPE
jgi:hypothetical protein